MKMIAHSAATALGIFPIKKGPVRFAVGDPSGLTSNSWGLYTNKKGDIYVSCRDNFKEAKVSLHVSGRWRMGYTTEAIAANSDLLLLPQENRAWEVWDKPEPQLPHVTIAFRLLFPNAELAVKPEQRSGDKWKNIIYIEGPPEGKLTVATLFITEGDIPLVHASESFFCMASLQIGEGQWAKLIMHSEAEGKIPELINGNIKEAMLQCATASIEVPEQAYAYLWGKMEDQSRFLVGARMQRTV
jgi:hypothetical protein